MAFEEDVPLATLSTFRIGGPARYFCVVESIEAMQEAIGQCHRRGLDFLVVGKGSNCLFDDRGFDGLVIQNKIEFLEEPGDGLFRVGSGYSFGLLGVKTSRKGWTGLEFASGIPASVGGAIFMNAGASGGETGDCLASVEWVDGEGNLHKEGRGDLDFRYRWSPFHERRGAIVAAEFQLEPCDSARQKQLDIVAYRMTTQPYGEPSAGCVFRNPDGGHAGKLIEEAGLKGCSEGGAEVSDVHANFIINRGEASADDVIRLIDKVRKRVSEASGVDLESEVRVIPYRLGG